LIAVNISEKVQLNQSTI